MSYQVFARKYRPQTFDDILGQDHVVQTLRNAIDQDRLAHAYLFVGPRGTGKTSTARILGKALNCTGGPKVDFDPDEDICREIAQGNCLDVLEIDGASNRGIDEVRELRESVKFAPSRGRYRIYYIDEVHMLTTQAFNALLKTLEEPPAHVKFIFATTEPTKILPTIISRCQRFDLRRIPDKIIGDHLLYIAKNEGVALDRKAAHAIAKGSEGGMRDAQSMLDQLVAFCGDAINESDVLEIFGFTSYETVASLCEQIFTGDTASALNQLHDQSELGKDLSKLLSDLISHLRNVLVCKVDPKASSTELATEVVETLRRQSALVETDRLLNLIDVFAETDQRMKWAPNKKLHFEVGIIRAVTSLAESRISDVIHLLDQSLEGNAPSLPKPHSGPAARTSKPNPAVPPSPAAPISTSGSSSSSPSPKPATAAATSAPKPAAAAPAAKPAAPVASNLTGEALWKALSAEVNQRRPLASAWLKAGHFCGVEGRHFMIAFSEDDTFARDSVIRPNNKGFIEDLLAKLSGGALTLKTEIRNDLAAKDVVPPQAAPPPEPAPEAAPAEAVPEPVSAAKASPSAAPETPAPKKSSAKPEPQSESESESTTRGDFNDDPLIQEALKVFEGEIK